MSNSTNLSRASQFTFRVLHSQQLVFAATRC